MKAILIDPIKKTIEEVEHTGDIDSIYKLLDCSMFETPIHYPNDDVMYCDESAWLHIKEPYAGFEFPGWSYAILGKGLIVGTNNEGEDVDCKSSINDFKTIIWKSQEEMKRQGYNMGMI